MIHASRLSLLALWVAGTVASAPATAGDFPKVRISGFASVTGGKILSSSGDGFSPDPETPAPIYLADWSNYGVYTNRFSLRPESHAGIQAIVSFSDEFRFTGQAVIRAVDWKPELTWAYLSYDLTPKLEIQAGRKRIPLYYYSDFQDVGYSLAWVSAPPELYGWDATNYNGGSLRFKTILGGASFSSSVFGGSETVKESRYMRSVGQRHTDVTWGGIHGVDAEVSKDWLTVRGVYVEAKPSYRDRDLPANDYDSKMKAYSLAINADFGELFALSEIGSNDRDFLDGTVTKAPAFSIGAGYRLDKWTPFLNFAQYRELSTVPGYAPVNYKRGSFTLRYDLTSTTAIKMQVDRYLEFNGTAYTTDSTLFRLSFDLVF